MGDEEIYEDDFEIDTGLCDELQGVKQDDPVLKDEGKLAAQERLGTSGEEKVDGRSCHKRTVVTTKKEAAILDCGHVEIDSANETIRTSHVEIDSANETTYW